MAVFRSNILIISEEAKFLVPTHQKTTKAPHSHRFIGRDWHHMDQVAIIWPKRTKNAYFGPILAVLGPTILIFFWRRHKFWYTHKQKTTTKVKKKAHNQVSYVCLLVEPQSFLFGTWILPQSMNNVKNTSKFHEKMAVFCHYLAMNGKLWVQKKFSTYSYLVPEMIW